jgi:hypothetical protein
MSFGEGSDTGYATSRGRDWPSVRQFNVFLANRIGALMDVVRRFESTDVRIVSLTVVDSADCAIIRMVLSDPERAIEIFEQAKLPITESDLLVVQLPESRQPLVDICKALLSAEINIHYAYPLLIGVGPLGSTAVAMHVDDHETAVNVLVSKGFTIFTENELKLLETRRMAAKNTKRRPKRSKNSGPRLPCQSPVFWFSFSCFSWPFVFAFSRGRLSACEPFAPYGIATTVCTSSAR